MVPWWSCLHRAQVDIVLFCLACILFFVIRYPERFSLGTQTFKSACRYSGESYHDRRRHCDQGLQVRQAFLSQCSHMGPISILDILIAATIICKGDEAGIKFEIRTRRSVDKSPNCSEAIASGWRTDGPRGLPTRTENLVLPRNKEISYS